MPLSPPFLRAAKRARVAYNEHIHVYMYLQRKYHLQGRRTYEGFVRAFALVLSNDPRNASARDETLESKVGLKRKQNKKKQKKKKPFVLFVASPRRPTSHFFLIKRGRRLEARQAPAFFFLRRSRTGSRYNSVRNRTYASCHFDRYGRFITSHTTLGPREEELVANSIEFSALHRRVLKAVVREVSPILIISTVRSRYAPHSFFFFFKKIGTRENL